MQEAPRIAEGLCSIARVHEMRNEMDNRIPMQFLHRKHLTMVLTLSTI